MDTQQVCVILSACAFLRPSSPRDLCFIPNVLSPDLRALHSGLNLPKFSLSPLCMATPLFYYLLHLSDTTFGLVLCSALMGVHAGWTVCAFELVFAHVGG